MASKIFAEVERVENLSVKDFKMNYLDKCIPVIIENYLSTWPAFNWTLDSVKKKAGHRDVFVRRNTDSDDYKLGQKYNIESMKFEEYITNIQQGNKKANTSYLAVQNIKKTFPELDTDLKVPEYIGKVHGGPFLWVAHQGHYEFCHFDPDDNFLIVISGKKHVRLYECDVENMYPNKLGSKGKTIQSQVNCDYPDLEKFPQFKNVLSYECFIESGEMLFFPAFWWHQVTSVETTISVNIFFGDEGTNSYISKVMKGPQWKSFEYWLLNIIEQNKDKESFKRVLNYLPLSIKNFLLKQWHEIPNDEQLKTLTHAVMDYLGLNELPNTEKTIANHAPSLKIRGLLWRS